MIREVQFLMDQHDAHGFGIARTIEGLDYAVDGKRTRSRTFIAGEDLHQRRLARAVLAKQAVDASGCEIEAHAMQHANGSELFFDVVEADGQAHDYALLRIISLCGSSTPGTCTFGSRRRLSSRRAAVSPSSRMGCATVVSGGSICAATAISSKPITAMSSGTRKPTPRKPLITPIARVSETANTAVGRLRRRRVSLRAAVSPAA